MLDLPIGDETDPVAGPTQSVAEFDVFDRRLAIALVESADRHECLAPNGPASCPEGLRLARAVLMRVVVEQVAVARDNARRGRLIIVGTDDRVRFGVFLEILRGARHEIPGERDIRVGKDDHRAVGCSGAGIPRRRNTGRQRAGCHPKAVSLCRLFDRFVRSVDGHNDLLRLGVEPGGTVKASVQHRPGTVGGDDKAGGHGRRVGLYRLGLRVASLPRGSPRGTGRNRVCQAVSICLNFILIVHEPTRPAQAIHHRGRRYRRF